MALVYYEAWHAKVTRVVVIFQTIFAAVLILWTKKDRFFSVSRGVHLFASVHSA